MTAKEIKLHRELLWPACDGTKMLSMGLKVIGKTYVGWRISVSSHYHYQECDLIKNCRYSFLLTDVQRLHSALQISLHASWHILTTLLYFEKDIDKKTSFASFPRSQTCYTNTNDKPHRSVDHKAKYKLKKVKNKRNSGQWSVSYDLNRQSRMWETHPFTWL